MPTQPITPQTPGIVPQGYTRPIPILGQPPSGGLPGQMTPQEAMARLQAQGIQPTRRWQT